MTAPRFCSNAHNTGTKSPPGQQGRYESANTARQQSLEAHSEAASRAVRMSTGSEWCAIQQARSCSM
jgi:hypothetical protein